MSRVPFDPELLDPDEPFEIDHDNQPHLAKHSPYTDIDLHDAWADPDLLFAEAAADGPADWLLIAALPGGDVIQVPLALPEARTGGAAGPSGSTRPTALSERCTNGSRSDDDL